MKYIYPLMLLVFCMLPSSALADPIKPWLLENTNNEQYMGNGFQFIYFDNDNDLTPSEAMRTARDGVFDTVNIETPSLGYTQTTTWIYLKLDATNLSSDNWYMVLRNPSLSLIDIYESAGKRTIPRWRTGSARSFYSRPVSHRDFVFPVDFSIHKSQEFLIRVHSSIAMQLPLTLQSYDGFWADEQYNQAQIGLFFGMAIVMVIFNLFIFLMIGDRGYIPYVIFVISLTTFLGTMEGLGYQFLWPESSRFNGAALTVSLAASAASGLLFVNWFLEMQTIRPRTSIALTLVTRMLWLVALAAMFMPFSTVIKPAIGLSVLGVTIAFVAGIAEWRNGSATARYFTISWLGIVFGAFALAFSKLGFIPRTTLTTYSLHYGAAAEFVMLAMALGARINRVREETEQADTESEKLRGQLNKEMEARIQIFSNMAKALDKPLRALEVSSGHYRQSLASATYITDSVFDLSGGTTQVTDMSLRAEKNNVDQRHHLTSLERHSQRLADVVEEMKALSNEPKKSNRLISLNELWEKAIDDSRQSVGRVFEHVQFKENISSAAPKVSVHGNPFILTDALNSMLTYAIRHALTGRMPVLHVRMTEDSNSVRLLFSSNGNPISPEMAFEIFEVENESIQTDLAVTRAIIQQQGGNIVLRNPGRADRATEFEFTLSKE
jgi:signal transduction histidine kinase